jgi:tRNA pseudouridine38-40 synthase
LPHAAKIYIRSKNIKKRITGTAYLYAMRYFLEISYNGAQYNGWQTQPNGTAVQQVIDHCLSTITREPVHCLGCGRTDTGVHASQFFLHFDVEAALPEDFVRRMNALAPPDIAIHRVIPVHPEAHARFDATLRSYEYIFCHHKDVYRQGLVFYQPYLELDVALMQQACAILLQFDDFPSFCKSKSGAKTYIVHLQEARWEQRADDLVFIISGNRFLRGMVRLVVGAMIQIGKGKMTLEEFESGIREKRRFRLALSAPAHGLYLCRVEYPYL